MKPITRVTIAIPQSSVMKNVTGVRWGNYVGSPDHPDPVMAWSQNHGSLIASLVALPTEDVFGLRLHSSLLVMYSKEKGRQRIFFC